MRVAESLHLVDGLGLEEGPDSSQLRDTRVSLHGDEVGSDPLRHIQRGVLEELINHLATQHIVQNEATHGLDGGLRDVTRDLLVLSTADERGRNLLGVAESKLVVTLNGLSNVSNGLFKIRTEIHMLFCVYYWHWIK